VESDIWEREEDLKNAKELVDNFEGRLGMEVRKQNMELNPRANEFKRMELSEKYMVKLSYGWDDKKLKEEYLMKLEKNWQRWKEDMQIDENEYLRRIEEREEEEKEKMYERDWRIGHFSRGEILKGE